MGKEPTEKEKHPAATAPYKLASRSCNACYQRKVRCDRGVPCKNCDKHGVTCVYPTKPPPDADGGTVKKGPSLQSIANRLERVEDLLTRLVERSEEFGQSTAPLPIRLPASIKATSHPIDTPRNQQPSPQTEQTQQSQQNQQPPSTTWEILLNGEHDERALPFVGTPSTGNTPQSAIANKTSGSASNTPSNGPFKQKNTPVATHHDVHSSDSRPRVDAGVLSNDDADVLTLYPNTQLALQLWSVYVKQVDPVLKILHIPTVQSTVVQTILEPRLAAPSTLALAFAIYYAAVTSMCSDEDDTPSSLPADDRRTLLSRFKIALDQLLTVSHLVNQPDIPSIQALAIYVTCLRAHEVGRSVWILNGLAIRLAQSMGLHRDGAHLKLSPFETEMRLRLWWHLCILDSRAPEDQGLQPTIAVTNWELRIPLNVNDAQLYPEMTELPAESTAWTDMSFFLLQTEACRRMHPLMETLERQSGAPSSATDGPTTGAPDRPANIADITEALHRIRARHESIRDAARYMHSRFGVEPDVGLPTDMPRIATTHMATACKKMEFVLQLREEILLKRVDDKPEVPPLQTTSFSLACDALSCSRTLKHDSEAAHYSWFFNMYTQWYALAYVLRCLCCSREAAMEAVAEWAWSLVDDLFPSGLRLHGRDDAESDSGETSGDDGSIWSYLHRLRHQASLVREQAQLDASCRSGVATAVAEARQPVMDREMQGSASNDASLPSAGLVQENNQDLFSSLDLFMADIQFLPDWDTVINM